MIPDRSLIKQAQDLRENGLTIRAIAKRLNISKSSVQRFTSLGVTNEGRQRPRRTREQKETIKSRTSEQLPKPKPTAQDQIADFIATKGVTKCPTVYLVPTLRRWSKLMIPAPPT